MILRQLFRTLVFALLCFFCLDSYSQTICSYGFRKRITFNPSYVSGSSDLEDFPVVIKISGDNNLKVTGTAGHVENTNGYDIIFTAADGVTKLDHQLVSYSSTGGNLECWVKIPLLSTTIETNIYMYYGNPAITTNPSSSNTWSNGYVGVWHFDNNLNNSTTVSGLNGTNNGSSNSTTAMLGGNSRSFDNGSNEYIDVSPYNSTYDLTNNITVSGWIRLASNGFDQKIAGNQNDVNGGWKFGVFSDNKLEFEIRNSSNAPFLSRSAGGGSALSNNTWYHVVGEYSNPGDFIDTYLNGSLDRSYTTTEPNASSNGTMKIGREPFSSGAYLDGRIDELRISNVIRSAGWIETEYTNQKTPGPGAFYSISDEPKVWTGGTSTNYSTGSNWLNGDNPGSNDDVIITNGSHDPTLQSNQQVNSIFIKSGATLSLSNRKLSVRSDITNCGTITGGTGEVVFNSTNSYVRNQYLSGSGTYNLRDLTVNNTFGSSPSLVLNKDVSVSGDLTLTSGIVYTDATSILALGTGATSTSGSANSFVSGPMSKAGTANFVFPVGKGTLWRRAAISGITASSTFRAEYFDEAFSNVTPVNAPLHNVSTEEYWQVDRIAGSGNAKLALYWQSAGLSGITNCADLTIARWNGSSWDERPGSTNGGSSCTGSGTGIITSNAVITAFSPFTFGSKLTGVNPLPIQLLDFKATCKTNGVLLNWTTASESNNAYFMIEKSFDGIEWADINHTQGAGTSNVQKNYSFTDALNSEQVVYYKLSQVDLDGKKESFGVISVDCPASRENMLVYPNPADNEIILQLDLSHNYGKGFIKIIDNLGKTCLEHALDLLKGENSNRLPLNLPPGSYTILLISDQLVLPAQKLIVK